jgi:organic radical activating enzyme
MKRDGGEPLMRHGQMAFIEMMEEFKYKDNIPSSITFETNGTQQLTDDFVDYVTNEDKHYVHTFISCSPKLWTVAGEKAEKAIKPDNLVEYNRVFKKSNKPTGQLKFVLGSKDEQWEELEHVIDQFRSKGLDWPVYIMPVGATVEEQEEGAGKVAAMAFERGYNVSGRLHCYLFGNAIGT